MESLQEGPASYKSSYDHPGIILILVWGQALPLGILGSLGLGLLNLLEPRPLRTSLAFCAQPKWVNPVAQTPQIPSSCTPLGPRAFFPFPFLSYPYLSTPPLDRKAPSAIAEGSWSSFLTDYSGASPPLSQRFFFRGLGQEKQKKVPSREGGGLDFFTKKNVFK